MNREGLEIIYLVLTIMAILGMYIEFMNWLEEMERQQDNEWKSEHK